LTNFTTDKPVIFASLAVAGHPSQADLHDRNAVVAAIEHQFIAVSYGHTTFLPAAWIWLSLWRMGGHFRCLRRQSM
jgi:hypothetical protein